MHPPGPGVGSVPSCVSASDPHGAGQPGPTKENWGELGGNHIDTPASQQATGTPHRRTSGTDSEPLWPHTPIDLHKRLRGPYSRIRTNDALQVQMPCADPQEISPRPTPQHRCLVAMAIVGWHGRASHRAWKRVPGRTSFHPLREFTRRARTAYALCAHRVRNLNNSSRKWSIFEALVNTVLWCRLLGEELWQGVRAPLGELTCNQCSNGLKDDESLPPIPISHVATLPKFLLQCQGQLWGKA